MLLVFGFTRFYVLSLFHKVVICVGLEMSAWSLFYILCLYVHCKPQTQTVVTSYFWHLNVYTPQRAVELLRSCNC